MNLKNHDSVSKFLSHVKRHTHEHKIKFLITRGSDVNIGHGVGRATGCFNSETIRVAGKNPFRKVLGTVAHEYGHFLQFVNKEEVWMNAARVNVDAVLYDKSVSKSRIDRMLELDKLLEIDAEKKAVDLIREWKLPIDVETYIKEANAYIYFYVHMLKYRRWCTKAPSTLPSILDLMPSKFCRHYDKLPEEYETLINRYCL